MINYRVVKSKILPLLVMSIVLLPLSFASAQEQPLPDVGSYSDDALAARLAVLRERYRINLSSKEVEDVVARCVQAQGGLKKISGKLTTVATSRSKTYSEVVGSLSSLRSLVVDKQIDASNIELLVVEYQHKIQLFEDAISAYQVTLDDSTRVDCKAKPEEFRAALEGVRAARKLVVSASAQIEEITKSNLKTAFDTVRDRLQTEQTTNGQ
jgi:hypothetical protein